MDKLTRGELFILNEIDSVPDKIASAYVLRAAVKFTTRGFATVINRMVDNRLVARTDDGRITITFAGMQAHRKANALPQMRMVDYEPVAADRMSGDAFVMLARQILAQRGTGNFHNDWLEIRTNYNGLDLQVTRNGQMDARGTRLDHLTSTNPVTMVKDGNVIRHHGEYVWLTAHMRALIAKGA
jgi:hypothetical protein